MTRVFASMDPLLVEHVRSVLENSGIKCHVAHRDLRSLAGAIPFSECWPEVWVVDDSQAGAAERLIAELTAPHPSVQGLWRCEHCGEALSSRFTSCWKCAGADEMRAERRSTHETRIRIRARYPRVFLWIAFVLMAGMTLVMLNAESRTWW